MFDILDISEVQEIRENEFRIRLELVKIVIGSFLFVYSIKTLEY